MSEKRPSMHIGRRWWSILVCAPLKNTYGHQFRTGLLRVDAWCMQAWLDSSMHSGLECVSIIYWCTECLVTVLWCNHWRLMSKTATRTTMLWETLIFEADDNSVDPDQTMSTLFAEVFLSNHEQFQFSNCKFWEGVLHWQTSLKNLRIVKHHLYMTAFWHDVDFIHG